MGLSSFHIPFYILFSYFLHFCYSASTPTTWVTDPRFVTGKKNTNLGTFTYNPPVMTLLSDSVTITYATPMSGCNRDVALGLADF